ncbi:hypothetical protein CHH83_01995 [Bacillus sp. 7586-K]|nr:hypothetical protein CHH83_01995 [Bacillus sp. 7586-K]
MKYKAIVSAHIWIDEDGDKDIEILTQIDNDDKGTDIFCDIDHALIDNIETGDSDDYYFIAIIESKFERTETLEGIEYDAEHDITEIKKVEDF